MKKLTKIAVALFMMVVFAQNSNAQFKFSVGAELGFALEDGWGLMYGASVGGEMLMGDNGGITAKLGYLLAPVDAGFFENASSSFMPMQLGYKYYFDSNEGGAYVQGQIGMTIYSLSYDIEVPQFDPVTFAVTYKTESFSASESYLSYCFGGGYLLNEHLDFGLGYNIVSAEGGSFNYIGARVAYQF